MIQPPELKKTRPMKLHDGAVSTTTDVWKMLLASCEGVLPQVKELAQSCRVLLTCQYDYTSPLHLAVREGHLNVVRYLVEQGTLDPGYKTHPFGDSLITLADDRGYHEIAALLRVSLDDPNLSHERGDTGKIDFGKSDIERRFQTLVDTSKHAEVEAMLKEKPQLARDDDAFWGEGILAMPAKDGDRRMLELLMSYGASVPAISKWGARYYFKKYEIAVFLLENGMNPNHANWRGFTLLHDMAHTGDIQKARLLLEHGADVNCVDEEYRSTPLGYAAHWGHREIVSILLERGADAEKAGAAWSSPLAWARKKGRADIEADLLRAIAA